MLWKKNYEKKRNPANDRIAVAFLGEWGFVNYSEIICYSTKNLL